jgi:hypothetical protein
MARPFNSQWPPEERAAYDAVFSEACIRETTSESVGYLQKVVTAAAEKGERWAVWTLDSAASNGLGLQYRAFARAQSGSEKFLCDLNGQVISEPKVAGTKVRTSTGKQAYQQVLFEVMTLAQLNSSIAETARNESGLAINRAHMKIYVTLCEAGNDALGLTPESPEWDRMTPQQAADILNTTVDDWLLAGGDANG